jgi:hypothetical protein
MVTSGSTNQEPLRTISFSSLIIRSESGTMHQSWLLPYETDYRDAEQGRLCGHPARPPQVKSIVEEERHHVLERIPAATDGTHAAMSNKSYI